MLRRLLIGAALSAAASSSAQAQTSMSFEQTAYVTCREAQAMSPDARRALAIFLIEHASRRRGVVIPEGELGGQIGYLVRGGCTLAPDACLFTVINRAVQAEAGKLPKRQ
jgi:hypothetical protein